MEPDDASGLQPSFCSGFELHNETRLVFADYLLSHMYERNKTKASEVSFWSSIFDAVKVLVAFLLNEAPILKREWCLTLIDAK